MKAHLVPHVAPGRWLVIIGILAGAPLRGQTVFPLATNPQAVEFASGLASDGSGHLLVMLADGRVGALRVNAAGSLPSEALELGSSPDFPPASAVAFAAPHYLVAWTDTGGPALGQLFSPTGEPLGDPLVVAAGTQSVPAYIRGLASDGSRFLAVLQDAIPEGRGSLRGQVLNPDGSKAGGLFLLGDAQGGEIWTSTMTVGEGAFLVAWQRHDPSLQGQSQDLVTEAVIVQWSAEAGAKVGTPVTLSEQPSSDRNPLTAAYDGQRFLVVWNYSGPQGPDSDGHPEPELQLHGRFVNGQSQPEGPELTLVADERSHFPALAFDGIDYLLCWHQGDESTIWSQFLSRDGAARPERHQIPGLPPAQGPRIGFPVLAFDGRRYFAVLNLLGVELNGDGEMVGFNSGDVYGVFLEPEAPVSGAPARLELLDVSSANGTQLRVVGTPGVAYRVESATNVSGPWSEVGGGTPGADGSLLFNSLPSPTDHCFYRAVSP